MTAAEYELATRAVALQVYRVFVGSSVAALLLCPLTVWLLDKQFNDDAAMFGIGLVVAVLTMGVPMFFVLQWSEKKWVQLRYEQDEDQRVAMFKLVQEHKRKNTKEADSGEDEVRPEHPEPSRGEDPVV